MFGLEFFGCRGSTPVSRSSVLKYGGNTTCIAVYAGERLLIVDCGTGLAGLQTALFQSGRYHSADILVTHSHWDHVQGIPFFSPLFSPENVFTFYSEMREGRTFSQQLEQLMAPPLFPIRAASLGAQITYREITCGETLELGGVCVQTARLTHPNTCTGFRVYYGEKSVCVVGDYEHGGRDVYAFAQGADVVIYDAQYQDEEYERKKGWGHSTWREGCKLAQACGVKQLYLTHHDPSRSDAELEVMEREAQQVFSNSRFAFEGLRAEI